MVEKLDGVQSASAPCESYQDEGTISGGGFTGRARLVTVHGGRVIDRCPSGQYRGFAHPASAGAGMATG
jgi:hypothetical protein